MRPARCFRQAIAGHAGHDVTDGGLKGDPMANGNKDRFDALSGAQDGTDYFFRVHERRPLAFFSRDWAMCANEPRLGHTDGRQIGEYP